MREPNHPKHRGPGRILVLGAILGVVVALVAPSASAATATLKPEHVGSTNPGFETGDCPAPPAGALGDWGWHFVLQGSDTTFNSISVQFDTGTVTDFVSTPTGKHAYVFTSGPATLLGATADVTGPDLTFNLSHVCTGTTGGGGGGGGGGVPGGGVAAAQPVPGQARFTG